MSGYLIKSTSRLLLVFCLVTGALALPGLYTPGVTSTLDGSDTWLAMRAWAEGMTEVVLNLIALLIISTGVEQTVGFGRRSRLELVEIWDSLPRRLRRSLVGLGILLIPFELHGLLGYLLEATISSELGGRYDAWMLAIHLPRFFVFAPISLINCAVALILTAILVVAHFRLPRWGRVPLPGGALTKISTQSFDFDPDSAEYKKKRKAERYIEKGRLVKAARLFESLGREYAYRAGRLYHKSGRDRDASRTFGAAGDYYLERTNYARAGDAYYFGAHWMKAVDAYKRAAAPEAVIGERERILEMVRRWGESLYRLGRFLEAAGLYEKHELHKLAGEAYEKGGRPREAAEAYGRAGAFDASFKALLDSGHHELAQVEKGKLHLQRDEYLEAAREFEKGKHFLYAAEAFEKANITGKAARNYLLAGKPEIAGTLFLASGEEFQALNCYEVMEDWDKAASLAAHMGLQDKQALYYERAGYWIAAARSYLMIYESERAVACLSNVDINGETIAAECAHLLTLLLQQNRLKEALSCASGLLEGKKARRDLAPLVFVLARIQEKMGKLDKAAKFYIQSAKLVPGHEEYVGNAKRLAAKLGIERPLDRELEREPPQGQGPGRDQRASAVPAAKAEIPVRSEPAVSETPAERKRSSAEAKKTVRKPRFTEIPAFQPKIAGDEVTLTMDEQTVYDLTEEGSLKRYQVIGEIGRGGMGYVYKALDKKLKRFVALKMLHTQMNNEPRVVLFFKREAMSIASLNHPNLVSLYDMGKEKGCFYMVMEYLEGGTLKTYIRKNPGVLRRHLVTVWLQVCEGMRYAHANGIIHRDIKPTNVMITRDRRVKILDFGLAKAVTDVNQTQQLWGTPSFMAPELFQGDRAGFQTDIYGLGATFYMVATGKKPFTDKDLGRKFSGDGLPSPPHRVDPRVPREISAVIQRCMYVNPEDRFQSVEELMRELKGLERQRARARET